MEFFERSARTARCLLRASPFPPIVSDAAVVLLAVVLGVIVRASVNRLLDGSASGLVSTTSAAAPASIEAWAAAACVLIGVGGLTCTARGAREGGGLEGKCLPTKEEEEQQQDEEEEAQAPAEPVWDPLQFSADDRRRWRMLEVKYGHLTLLANVGLVGTRQFSNASSRLADLDSNCSTESPETCAESGESCASSDREVPAASDAEEAERAPVVKDATGVQDAPGGPLAAAQCSNCGLGSRPDELAAAPVPASGDAATAPQPGRGNLQELARELLVTGNRHDRSGVDRTPAEPANLSEEDPNDGQGAYQELPTAPADKSDEAAPAEASCSGADFPTDVGEALSFVFPPGSLWSEFPEDGSEFAAGAEREAPDQEEPGVTTVSEEEPVLVRRWGRLGTAARSEGCEDDPSAPQPAEQAPPLDDFLGADAAKCQGWRLRAAADLQRCPAQQAPVVRAPLPALPKKLRKNPNDKDLPMQKIMQCLEGVNQECVLIIRKMKKLGFDSPGILRMHFGKFGSVETVYVSHSHLQGRMRPASLGFVVMDSKESVSKSLASGYVHVMHDVPIYVDAFEQFERREPVQAAAGNDDSS